LIFAYRYWSIHVFLTSKISQNIIPLIKNIVPLSLVAILTMMAVFGFSIAADPAEEMTHIELTVTGIRGHSGTLGLGIFDNQKSFDDEVAQKSLHFKKSDIVNGTMTVSFDIEPKVCGFSILDDENSNDKMDYNLLGIPKEGFGFSDYYHSGLSKPHFDSFKLDLKPGESRKVEMKLRYIL